MIELYHAAVEECAPVLPELPIKLADFAVWQRTWLDAGEKDRQLAYWRQLLGMAHPMLTERSGVADGREANYGFIFDRKLSAQVRAFARANHASVFIVMQAVFALALFRYSGSKEIRVGIPVVNRRRVETHNLVGYLTNVQVLPTLIDPAQNFMQLITHVKERVLDGQMHQDVPFDVLKAWVMAC